MIPRWFHFFAGLVFLGTGFLSIPSSAVIYGQDSRMDLYEVEPTSPVYQAASAVAAVVHARELVPDQSSELYSLKEYTTLKGRKRVCENVRYSEQPTLGFCSSFLIAPDKVVMARHCLMPTHCGQMRFVFGYKLKDPQDKSLTPFSPSQIYSCKDFSYPRDPGTGEPNFDFVAVTLDREVTDRQPLKMRVGPARKDAELYSWGHPNGLPQKLTSGGFLESQQESYFLTRLDTFQGNSGSPVLNADTHEVEGVLIDGERDYDNAGGCQVPRVCTDDSCQGEMVLDISVVQDFLS